MFLYGFSIIKAILEIVATILVFGWPVLVLLGVLAGLALLANNIDKVLPTPKVARLDSSFSTLETIGALLAAAVAILLLLLYGLKELGRHLLKRWRRPR